MESCRHQLNFGKWQIHLSSCQKARGGLNIGVELFFDGYLKDSDHKCTLCISFSPFIHQGKGSITTQKRDRAPAYFAISKAQRNSHLVHGSKRYGYPNSIYTDLPFTLKATHKSSMQAIVWPFPPPLHPPYMQNYVFVSI